MLIFADNLRAINFSMLMDVYAEGNMENGAARYPHASQQQQLMYAEQDFYQYLNEVFFRNHDAVYAIWADHCRYTAALRLEPYRDGLILCALETRPDAREQGFASALIRATVERLSQYSSGTIYSHVSKSNLPSLAVHRNCGFTVCMEHAVYLDGSVNQNCYTMVLQYKNRDL